MSGKCPEKSRWRIGPTVHCYLHMHDYIKRNITRSTVTSLELLALRILPFIKSK